MDFGNLGIDPLGKIGAWGNPWHGIVVNTTLTLPDASTRTHPAVSLNDCFDFHVPGAPGGAGAVDPEGGSWRDYLLLSYGEFGPIVYGVQGGFGPVSWLYAHPDGSRWMVSVFNSSISGIAMSNDALTINLAARRFGEFGVDTEIINFSVSLAARGLSPAPSGVAEGMPASVSIGISDVTADGSKCCLMFYAHKAAAELTDQRFPYAYFEVVLSASAFSASTATLLYDIATVAGSGRGVGISADLTQSIETGEGITPPCTWYTRTITYDPPGLYGPYNCIIAAWYHDGAIVPIYFSHRQDIVESFTWDAEWLYSATNACGTEFSETYDVHGLATVEVGNPTSGVFSMELRRDYAETIAKTIITGEGSDITETDTADTYRIMVGASEMFSSTYETSSVHNHFIGTYEPAAENQFIMSQNFSAFHPWQLEAAPVLPGTLEIPSFFVKRCSATLLALGWTWIDKVSGDRKTQVGRYMTKAGFIEHTYSVPDNVTLPELSATLQPVSHEVSIAADGAVRSFV